MTATLNKCPRGFQPLDKMQRKEILDCVSRALTDPSVRVGVEYGVVENPNYDTGWMEFRQSGERTITIEYNVNRVNTKQPKGITKRIKRKKK